MSGEGWAAIVALAIAVLGGMLHNERRLSTIQADIRWLIKLSVRRRGEDEPHRDSQG